MIQIPWLINSAHVLPQHQLVRSNNTQAQGIAASRTKSEISHLQNVKKYIYISPVAKGKSIVIYTKISPNISQWTETHKHTHRFTIRL